MMLKDQNFVSHMMVYVSYTKMVVSSLFVFFFFKI